VHRCCAVVSVQALMTPRCTRQWGSLHIESSWLTRAGECCHTVRTVVRTVVRAPVPRGEEEETRFELGNRTSRCIRTCNTYSPEYHARRGKGAEKVPLEAAGAAGGPPFAGSERKRAPEQRSFSFVLYYSSCALMIARPEFVKELPGPPWLTSRPYAPFVGRLCVLRTDTHNLPTNPGSHTPQLHLAPTTCT
jgi:hypothetical protein